VAAPARRWWRAAGGGVSVDGNVELRKTCKIRIGQVVTIGEVEIKVVADGKASSD
jgi:ribosome-associated protein